ncbi:MAG: hypothetical protein SCALA702_12370 [Melioribacteraceae bacterium]|nr:MAG: hypothetical protein SCALA702_12370 [Melioribacteraceae bacterium]
MKRIVYLFLPLILLIYACDDAGDSIVDSETDNLVVENISAPGSFTKTLSDSSFSTAVRFNTGEFVPESVWLNIKENNGSSVLYRNLPLADDGSTSSGDQTANDGVFSAIVFMSALDPSGKYNLEYYYSDATNTSRKLSVLQLNYDNGQNNLPPEIVNIYATDTLLITADTVATLIAAEISDVNGLRDVEEVWFTVTRPNGTSNGSKITLFDNGNEGDQTANDGIYSRGIIAVTGQTQGDYKFNFRARDKAGNLSEIIVHTITIVE